MEINNDKIKFPVFLHDEKQRKYFRYQECNSALIFSMSSILKTSTPYYMNTKKELVSFIKRLLNYDHVKQITETEFNEKLIFYANEIVSFEQTKYDFYPDEKIEDIKVKLKNYREV